MFLARKQCCPRTFADSSQAPFAHEREIASMKYLFDNLDEVKARVRESRRTYLLLDCDGTLTPIITEPQKVILSRRMSEVLRSLAGMPSCVLAIVSGRSLANVRRLVGIPRIYYMGNHGLEISGPRLNYTNRTAQNSRQSMEEISHTLQYLESIGASIEDKQLTLTVHFRQASPRVVPEIKSAVRRVLRAHPQLEVTSGKKVLEIRPRTEWNKGLAARWLINELGNGLSIYAGDDRTDEDAFSRLVGGITILVSQRWKATHAKYRLNDHRDVGRFLRCLSRWMS
jgi:trehalose-phosphatase